MTPADAPPDAASDRLVFDTAGLDADTAFARYRSLYGAGTDVMRLGPAFYARVEAWRLDRMLLYDRRLDDIGHRRTAERTRGDGFTHFTATLLLDGAIEVDGDDGSRSRLAPGEVMLVDTHRPTSNRMYGAHLVTLAVARERMAAVTDDVDRLHGLILGAGEARLFRDFVESLLRTLPAMGRPATMAAAGVLTSLLTIAIENQNSEPRPAAPSRDLERLGALKRLIDARLADPLFDTAAAVRESGLSRATLYRLLEAGGGVAALIRGRRLDALRRRLTDPAEPRPVAELSDAAGFASASQASRAFLDRFGLRPSEYREIAAAGSGADAFLKMRFWQEEVR